jgi:tryptophan synthase alpha chain
MVNGRYGKKFAILAQSGESAFIPFAVLGDPNTEISFKVLKTLVKHADCLELGLPFSDPIADGKTIQAADQRALAAGMNTDKAFKLIARIRKINSEIPIGLLVYYNLVYRRGVDKFYRDAKRAGVDGILIADMPIEESAPALAAAKKHNIDPIFLVTQTTGSGRMRKIARKGKGFLYAVSLLGVTGARAKLESSSLQLVKRAAKASALPICVGFGVSSPAHVKALKKAGAHGIIVGSAIEKVVEKNLSRTKAMLKTLDSFCAKLKDATR